MKCDECKMRCDECKMRCDEYKSDCDNNDLSDNKLNDNELNDNKRTYTTSQNMMFCKLIYFKEKNCSANKKRNSKKYSYNRY